MERLQQIMEKLVWNSIPFTVHYPTNRSAVVTVDNAVNNEQLMILATLGAIHNRQNNFMILAPDVEQLNS